MINSNSMKPPQTNPQFWLGVFSLSLLLHGLILWWIGINWGQGKSRDGSIDLIEVTNVSSFSSSLPPSPLLPEKTGITSPPAPLTKNQSSPVIPPLEKKVTPEEKTTLITKPTNVVSPKPTPVKNDKFLRPTPGAPQPTPLSPKSESPKPLPSPSNSPKPTPTASPTPSPSNSPKPTPTASPTPSPSNSPKPTPTASPSPSPKPSASPQPESSVTPPVRETPYPPPPTPKPSPSSEGPLPAPPPLPPSPGASPLSPSPLGMTARLEILGGGRDIPSQLAHPKDLQKTLTELPDPSLLNPGAPVTVEVLLQIDEQGKVIAVSQVTPPQHETWVIPLLKSWDFEPAQTQGKPVASDLRLKVTLAPR